MIAVVTLLLGTNVRSLVNMYFPGLEIVTGTESIGVCAWLVTARRDTPPTRQNEMKDGFIVVSDGLGGCVF